MKLRTATDADSQDIWEWKNDPLTREMSRDPTPVPRDAHDRWFAAVQQDENRVIFVAVDTQTGEKIGMVRFDADPASGTAETSINLNPAMRGRGLATPLLRHAVDHYAQASDSVLRAEVKSANTASIRVFGNAGFEECCEDRGIKTFRRAIKK